MKPRRQLFLTELELAALAQAAEARQAVQRALGPASAKMTLDTYGSLFEGNLEDLADRAVAQAWPKDAEIVRFPR